MRDANIAAALYSKLSRQARCPLTRFCAFNIKPQPQAPTSAQWSPSSSLA
jgi:hypothetical protein